MAVREFKLPEQSRDRGLPMFEIMNPDGMPNAAHIHIGHYDRMRAVIAAARSGDSLLIKLALAHHDEHGYGA